MSEIETFAATSPNFAFGDRVVQTTQSTGTGDITLLTGPIGMVRFQDEFTFENRFYYWLESESKELWEHGVGYLANSSRMVRETIIKTNAGTTDPIDLPSGTSLIWSASGADAIVIYDDDGGIDGRNIGDDGTKLDLITVTKPFNLDTYEPTTLDGLAQSTSATPNTIVARDSDGDVSIRDLSVRNVISWGAADFEGQVDLKFGLKVTQGAFDIYPRANLIGGADLTGTNNFYPETGSQYAFQQYFNKDGLLKFTFYTSNATTTGLNWRVGDGTTNAYKYGSFQHNGNIRLPVSVVPINVQDLTTKAYVDGLFSGDINAKTLNGQTNATSNIASTIVERNGSGDIAARLFRPDFAGTNSTINYIMTQKAVGKTDDGADNYIRPSTPAQFRAAVTDGNYAPTAGNSGQTFYASWFRSSGQTGFYCESYGGGTYMIDTTWLRVYGDKALYVKNTIASTGNVVAYYSDERLKDITEHLDPLESLSNVCKWSKVRYTANALAGELAGYDTDKPEIGLLTGEIKTDYPELTTRAPFDIETSEDGVQTSKSGEEYQTLDYERTIAVQASAIEGLNILVEKLTARLELLEAKV